MGSVPEMIRKGESETVAGASRTPSFAGNSLHLPGNSPDLGKNSPDLTRNSPDLRNKLTRILVSSGFPKMPGKLKSEVMKALILRLCAEEAVALKDLAAVLERDPKTLQEEYLTPMLAGGRLELKYPGTKNHPNQAYRTRKVG